MKLEGILKSDFYSVIPAVSCTTEFQRKVLINYDDIVMILVEYKLNFTRKTF